MYAVTEFCRAGRVGRPGARQDGSRGDPRGISAHHHQPRRHARPAPDGGCDLRCRPEAALLQSGLPEALGARPGLPRKRARPDAAARPAAQRRQAGRTARMAALEGDDPCRLPRHRSAGACLASARRAHAARRRQSAAQGRRDLGIREPDRTAQSGKPLPFGGARAGRDARQSGRGRRGVRPGRQGAACQSRLLSSVEPCRRAREDRHPYRRDPRRLRGTRDRQPMGRTRLRRDRLRRGTPRPARTGRNARRRRCCAMPSSTCRTAR